MASAGTVTVDFAAETAHFQSELKKVRGELGKMNEGFSQLQRVAGAALALFSANALVGFVRTAAEAADQFGKAADKIGVSTERLAAFHLAAQDAGVSLETIDKLLIDAQRRLGEAATGSGEAAKTIKALSLNVAQLQRLSPDQLFQRYAEAIGTLNTRSEKLAAAQDLFGKTAQEAFSLIEAGAPAIDAAAEAVDRYGLALSRTDIAKVEAANDRLELLGKISQAAGQRIAAGLSPFISAAARALLGAAGSTEDLQRKAEKFGAVAYTAFQVVANAAHALEAAFFGIAAAGARVLQFVTFGDVSKAFAASVDANLAKASQALDQVKSIEQIQQGIVQALETAGTEANANVQQQQQRAALTGTATLGTTGGDLGPAALANLAQANLEMVERLSEKAQASIAADGQRISQEVVRRIDEETRATARIYERNAQYRLELEQQTEQQLQAFREAGLNATLSLANSNNSKLRAIGKAAFMYQKAQSLAQAVISTKEAVMTTYAKLGYPWCIPAAAAMAAIGAAQITAIISTNPGSGGAASASVGGASVGTAATAALASGQASDQKSGISSSNVVTVNITGVVTSQVLEELFDGFGELVNGRDKLLINVNSRQAMEIRGA